VAYTVDVARVIEDSAWEVVMLDAYHISVISRPDMVVAELLARAP
jgi:predicted RNA methylase